MGKAVSRFVSEKTAKLFSKKSLVPNQKESQDRPCVALQNYIVDFGV